MKQYHFGKNSEYRKQLRLMPGYILLVFWLIFTVVVIGWIILASLSTTKGIFSGSLLSEGLHFENYIRVLKTHKMALYFFNSLIYSVVSCCCIVFVASPAAYVLGRFRFRGKAIANDCFVVAFSVPVIMIILPLFQMAAKADLIGSRWTLILLYIFINVPFSVFFLTGFFTSLPKSLEEAAQIDGCGPMRAFWKVMFPLAQPGIVTLTIFNFIAIWNDYLMAMIFANKSSLRTVATGLQTIVQSMKYSGDWAALFAGVVIVFLPTFILYLFLSDKIIAGVTSGSVKE